MASVQRTLLMIKPDGVEKKLRKVILDKIHDPASDFQLKIVREKTLWLTQDLVNAHYAEHTRKPHFVSMSRYLMRGPVIVFEVVGAHAISKIRGLCGATHPRDAAPGTIRAEHGRVSPLFLHIENVVHSSANDREASEEIKRFFGAKGAGKWEILMRKVGLRTGLE